MNEIIAANRAIPGRPGGTYTKLKRETEDWIRWEAEIQKFNRIDHPYRVDVVWTVTNSRRDPDNIRAGMKFILDALVKAELLRGDSTRWCRGIVDRFQLGPEPLVDAAFFPLLWER